MSKTLQLVEKVAKEYDWTPETMLLIVAGYLAELDDKCEARKFVEATLQYAVSSSMSMAAITKLMCLAADKYEEESRKQFDGYLTFSVLPEFKKVAAPLEPTKASDYSSSFPINKKMSSAMLQYMAYTEPDKTHHLGDVLFRWNKKIIDDVTLFADVVNSKPRPVLDLYVMKAEDVIASAKPFTWSDIVNSATHAAIIDSPFGKFDVCFEV